MGVWWAGLLMKRRERSFFRAHGVSDTQFNVLVLLQAAGRPLLQRELGERLLVDKSDLTGLVDRMEKAGLVERRAVKGDRRCNAVALTRKGHAALARTEPDYAALVNRVMEGFSDSEIASITSLMIRLHDALDC